MDMKEAKELMALDDIIKMNNRLSVAHSVAGSSKMSSAGQSRWGGFNAQGGFTGGAAARPKNIDWVWTKEGGSLTNVQPPKYFRGSGRGGMMRGNFGFRRPQRLFFQKNQRFYVSHQGHRQVSKFINPTRQNYRYPAQYVRFYRHQDVRTPAQQLLPVHQRLGWMVPSLAQNVARNRVKVASWYLNKRNQYSGVQYQPTNSANYIPNMLERRLLRQQKQQMSGTSSNFSVSVVNELANHRQFVVPKQMYRGGRAGGVARLSKQNVALLPNGGVTAQPNHSNRSQSYFSQHTYARSKRSQRNYDNKARMARRQLSIPPGHATSLSSIGHQLRPDPQPAGTQPTIHIVRLDQKIQSEISAIQRKAALNNGDSETLSIAAALDYRPAAFATTTSISDRFSVITTV